MPIIQPAEDNSGRTETYGFGEEPISLGQTRATLLFTAVEMINTPKMYVYSVPSTYCIGQYPSSRIDPINGLLMYKTEIQRQWQAQYGYGHQPMALATEGNTNIAPDTYTEASPTGGGTKDKVEFFVYSTVKPIYNNIHALTTSLYNPNSYPSSVSSSEIDFEDFGCVEVTNTSGNQILPSRYVWLRSYKVDDDGKDLFLGVGYQQHTFKSSSGAIKYYDKLERTNYILKRKGTFAPTVWTNTVNNWLYSTVQNLGTVVK